MFVVLDGKVDISLPIANGESKVIVAETHEFGGRHRKSHHLSDHLAAHWDHG